jgi:phosphocarrier protein
MAKRTVVVSHEKGLHARPATVFVETASAFEAAVEVGRVNDSEMADAKSSLAVMSLGVEDGTEIVIQSSDQDAVDSLVEVVESDFERAE